VHSIHARGVAFVDLAKKENVVVTSDGRPFLIDFQISISLARRGFPLSLLWNGIVRLMQQADIYHVYKHKKRIRPDLLREDELERARRPWFAHLHKFLLRIPYHAVKRRIIPKHGDSRYPIYERAAEDR